MTGSGVFLTIVQLLVDEVRQTSKKQTLFMLKSSTGKRLLSSAHKLSLNHVTETFSLASCRDYSWHQFQSFGSAFLHIIMRVFPAKSAHVYKMLIKGRILSGYYS